MGQSIFRKGATHKGFVTKKSGISKTKIVFLHSKRKNEEEQITSDDAKLLEEALKRETEACPNNRIELFKHVFDADDKISKKITLIDEAFLVKELGFDARVAALLLFEIKAYRTKIKISYKNVNDPVHGTIRLHPLAVAIIDTPPFQRLRHIQQLGMTSYVYPGGTHTRFEHSLGVYHLTGKLVEVLRKNQPESSSEVEALCIQIAALCHDLGHGPLSHIFEKGVIPEMKNNGDSFGNYSRSTYSKYIVDKLILPDPGTNETDQSASKQFYEEWGLRAKEKERILELVDENHLTSFYTHTVRWDYYLRDCHHLGLKNSFQPERLMQHLRTLKNPENKEKWELCVRDKERQELNNMFNTRVELHRRVYKHPVVLAVDMMMSTALHGVLNNTEIGQKSSNRETTLKRILNEDVTIDSLMAFINVDDRIVYQIMNTVAHEMEDKAKTALKNAQDLLQKIDERKLWKLVAILKRKKGDTIDIHAMTAHKPIQDLLGNGELKLKYVGMHFVEKENDRLTHIRFYDKEENLLPAENTGAVNPEIELVYVYCTDYKITREGIKNLREEILYFVDDMEYEEGQRP